MTLLRKAKKHIAKSMLIFPPHVLYKM